MPKVAIIILTWDQLALTLEQLKDVADLDVTGLEAETIIVDNGSKDGTSKKLKKYSLPNMKFKLMINKSNLGFAEGNNVGIKEALNKGSDYFLLLNNDLILPKELLVQLIKVMQSDRQIGILSPKMYFAKGYEYHKDRYSKGNLGKVLWYAGGKIDWNNIYSFHRGVDEVDRGQYNKNGLTDVANGACMLIRREVVKEIGYLDKEMFLYWEDADYSERARRKGWKVVYTPNAHLWHRVSQASGIGSDLNDYFLSRNRLVFGFRYANLRVKYALLRESFKLLITGRKWQKAGIKDFFLGRLGKGSWI